jgi:hypothetical protein
MNTTNYIVLATADGIRIVKENEWIKAHTQITLESFSIKDQNIQPDL